jgi:flagellar hook-basal body complex protein FliE
MNPIDNSSLLLQMRALAARAQSGINDAPKIGEAGAAGAAGGVDFSRVLRSALDNVSATQEVAQSLSSRFEAGDPKVDLSQVMISMQKANVSFQAVTQVRNKLVSAYQEIMSMPI